MFKWFKNLFKKKRITRSETTFTVPDGVTTVNVKIVGGGGSGGSGRLVDLRGLETLNTSGFTFGESTLLDGGKGSGPIAVDGKLFEEYYPADPNAILKERMDKFQNSLGLNNMKPGTLIKDLLDNVSYQSDSLSHFEKKKSKKKKTAKKKKYKKKGKKK